MTYKKGFSEGRRPIMGVAAIQLPWQFVPPYSKDRAEHTRYVQGFRAAQQSLYGHAYSPSQALLAQKMRNYPFEEFESAVMKGIADITDSDARKRIDNMQQMHMNVKKELEERNCELEETEREN